MSFYIIIFCIVLCFIVFSNTKNKKSENRQFINSQFSLAKEDTDTISLVQTRYTLNDILSLISSKTSNVDIDLIYKFFDYIYFLPEIYVDNLTKLPSDSLDKQKLYIKIYSITKWVYSFNSMELNQYIENLMRNLDYYNPKYCKNYIEILIG